MLIAHKPQFSGTEETQWGDVAKTFTAYRDGYYAHTDAEKPDDVPGTFPEAPAEMREWMGTKALLYDAEAETFSAACALRVVNPATDNLNAAGLRNALARASQVEGSSAEEIASAQETGRELLAAEFGDEEEAAEVASSTMAQLEVIKGHFDAGMELLLDMLAVEDMPAGDELPPAEEGGGEEEAQTAEMFQEIDAPIIRLVEQQSPINRRAPLELDVAIIGVGPGNARDNHYYTRELLERDGGIFEGVTMHVVDHREEQRSESTDVSTVQKILGIKEIDGGDYLVGRVLAYDPDFCEKTRNRADAGLLGKLQCSILATGEAAQGEIDGKAYNVVSAMTEARFVDWVTRAGAGGHALSLSESETPPEDAEDDDDLAENGAKTVVLSEDDKNVTEPLTPNAVVAFVNEHNPNLPASSVATLLEMEFDTLDDVENALKTEVARLKETGSGKPLAMGALEKKRPVSHKERVESLNEVNHKWLGGRNGRSNS